MRDYIDRINQIITYKRMSLRKLCIEIDCPYSTLNTFMNGKRESLDINIISSILNAFQDINPEWLITGYGDMLREVPGLIRDDGVEYKPYTPPPEETRQMIEDQREIIKQQRDLIKTLQEQLKLQQNNGLNYNPDVQEDDAAECADVIGW